MKKYDWSEEKVKQAIKESRSYSDTLRKLNIPLAGNNLSTLKRKIKEYGIDISHFTYENTWVNKEKVPIEEYLTNKRYITTCKLKKRLFEENIKENKCEICGTDSWMGKKIECQLHHKNGNRKDNSLENLQILCPNCHSQTDSFCIGNNRPEKRICPICGKNYIKTKAGKTCVHCSLIANKKVKRIPKEELIKLLEENNYNRLKISKLLSVSETSIRHWIKYYNISTRMSTRF